MTFEADHPGAHVAPSLGYREGSYSPRTAHAGIITHVTGSGPLSRYESGWRPSWAGLDDDSTLLDVAVALYTGVMGASSQYLVHEDTVVQLAPEDVAAWHVGSREAGQYDAPRWAERAHYRGESVDVSWWPERHPDVRSPLELAGGELWGSERSINGRCTGAEILWPHDADRSPPSEQTMRTWAALVRGYCERRGVPMEPHRCCLGHSDVHPAARSAGGEAWDPPPSVMDPLAAARRLGIPPWCPPPG